MKFLTCALVASVLLAPGAGAVGLPTSPDFSKWADKSLRAAGITDARVISTKYPFSFTYCEPGSMSLTRYNVISPEQLDALKQGEPAKPMAEAERRVMVESASPACSAAG